MALKLVIENEIIDGEKYYIKTILWKILLSVGYLYVILGTRNVC
jgi:hypothetical protein